ncbi:MULTISPECIES: hypothetical protein [Vitreoscilla]|uniref:Uncharacterized protein n=1 Tax=Vitreoscilla stercoraria TaxID=61 RepID=A0ABY4EBY3_VITST|nr:MULTISPECIES: hypothetical protein [Vitreoscilla]AUZ05629.1 hypothetical protein ADP71_22390 [Vitreoscilla sp. C1]UOO92957.1 hypothetical protein LVJ81_02650 [Vitreoscilla stercoraria]
MRHSVLFSMALLCLSHSIYANWTLSPDKWLQQQCHQYLSQLPQLKLSSSQHTPICRCMVTQAKQQLSVRDLWRLTQLSQAQLQQQYSQSTQAAFQICRAQILPKNK